MTDLSWIDEKDEATRQALLTHPELEGELREAVRQRMLAAEAEAEAKAAKARANGVLSPLFALLGLEKVVTTAGTCRPKAGVTVSHDMGKLKETLLANHVPMVVIELAVREAERKTAWETVEWRWAKGRGGMTNGEA